MCNTFAFQKFKIYEHTLNKFFTSAFKYAYFQHRPDYFPFSCSAFPVGDCELTGGKMGVYVCVFV